MTLNDLVSQAQYELRLADENARLARRTSDPKARQVATHFEREHRERAEILINSLRPGANTNS
jgi:hypothetical protein